jgi:hypothetical protein
MNNPQSFAVSLYIYSTLINAATVAVAIVAAAKQRKASRHVNLHFQTKKSQNDYNSERGSKDFNIRGPKILNSNPLVLM